MSSVAVLTQESFAEHRSGLVPQQIKGEAAPHCAGNVGPLQRCFAPRAVGGPGPSSEVGSICTALVCSVRWPQVVDGPTPDSKRGQCGSQGSALRD